MVSAVDRALIRLARSGSVLARTRNGAAFGVFASGDQRRRPLSVLKPREVTELIRDGALVEAGGRVVLTPAGRARAERLDQSPEEAFLAQHAPLATRTAKAQTGETVSVRAVEGLSKIARLAGAGQLSPAEWAAAKRYRQDWEAGQKGLTPGPSFAAPPGGSSARGPSTAAEIALTRASEARKRFGEARAALAPGLVRILDRACLLEDGLEEIERGERLPPRAGKMALRLALGQLAAHYAAR